jgi:Tfp pilus assembly protein FimT
MLQTRTRTRKNRRKGFALWELMIVIAIIFVFVCFIFAGVLWLAWRLYQSLSNPDEVEASLRFVWHSLHQLC